MAGVMFQEGERMQINSVTYECWHEMGHAFVCIALDGGVRCVERLDDHKLGRARARCITNQYIRQRVACGGFAAEFVLLRDGDIGPQNEKEITQVIFRNATIDREMYHSLVSGTDLSEAQDREFMNCAINSVASIIFTHKTEMAKAVKELERDGCVSGERIKQIMSGT
jgi:hypothetical protein